MTAPAPVAALWTRYDPAPGRPPEVCVTCGARIAPDRWVRVYADGLEHYACWLLSRARPPEPVPAPRPSAAGRVLLGTAGVAGVAGGLLALGGGPGWAVAWAVGVSLAALVAAVLRVAEGL